jgi:hypothetical protein
MITIVVSFPEYGRSLTHHYGVCQTGGLGSLSQQRALLEKAAS